MMAHILYALLWAMLDYHVLPEFESCVEAICDLKAFIPTYPFLSIGTMISLVIGRSRGVERVLQLRHIWTW